MFTWKAYYYFDGLPLTEYSSEDMEWKDLPSLGVISVEIRKDGRFHIMQGVDNYWMDGFKYGGFVNTGELGEIERNRRILENRQEAEYFGIMEYAYEWENEHIFLGEITPELDPSLIKAGIMMPDDLARQIGLLG